jgi:hypothetical protein
MTRFLTLTTAAVASMTMAVGATVLVPTEFRQVVADSTVIVRGHVTDIRVSAPPGGPVETIATVAVDSLLKGTADAFVSVRVPGGDLGRQRVVAIGSPTFARGDMALFFLKRGSDNGLRPVGLSLGVYRVKVDATTGDTSVAPPLATGITAPAGAVTHGDLNRRMLTVPEFESLVKAVMLAQARVSPRGRQ